MNSFPKIDRILEIDRIVEVLRNKWREHPDLRLGQLLENVARHLLYYHGDDLFYIADENLERGLRAYPKVYRSEG